MEDTLEGKGREGRVVIVQVRREGEDLGTGSSQRMWKERHVKAKGTEAGLRNWGRSGGGITTLISGSFQDGNSIRGEETEGGASFSFVGRGL